MGQNEKKEKTAARQSNLSRSNGSEAAIFRVLDASINRASEGLRVVESFTRMVLEDVSLSSQLKQLRHDLANACGQISSVHRLQSRDSESDIGRDVQTDSEYQRENLNSIVRSNMSRVQQATRTIEEYSKTLIPSVAKEVEQIRYRAYTLEKAIFNAAFNLSRFEKAHLYVLVDACGERSGFSKLSTLVSGLVEAGVDLIQLRDKTLTDRELVAAGKQIGNLTRDSKTLWVMNDRADLCVAAEADGVHIGQDELSVHEARMILRPNQFIGVSTHSLQQAHQAVVDGADYIGVGHVFESQTKCYDSFVGVDLVAAVVGQISLPAFAIGGINASNLAKVVEADCRRVAVSSAVCGASDPVAAAIELMNQLCETQA